MTFKVLSLTSAVILLCSTFASAEQISGPVIVLDGDTVSVNENKIRLSGIHSPETDQRCFSSLSEVYSCGISSRDALIAKFGSEMWIA